MVLDFDSLNEKYELKINGVLHIGAHHGQEYEMYKKYKISKCIFFEPVKNTFNVLLEKFANNDEIILINKALGNSIKDIDMFIETANHGQSSSILKPKIHLTQYPYIKFNSTEKVSMITLDSYNPDKIYNFINIDVQGYELEVFKGAEKTLEQIDYIMTEVNKDEVYEKCAKIWELDSYLEKYGFVRVEEKWSGGTWGDAFYIKK